MTYDSRPETYEHIARVQGLLIVIVKNLLHRIHVHDVTKLNPPEVEAFDTYTPKLKEMEYGSEEYKNCLRLMKPALENHYKYNRHHPEHFPDGIHDMTLVDLIEMLCDWIAASERMEDRKGLLDDGEYGGSSIRDSIATINQDRFEYSDELKGILLNTLNWIEQRQ